MSLPDTFTAANGTALSTYDATWVKHGNYSSGACDIQNNQVHLSTSSGVCYYYNSTPGSADYDVWADVYAPTASESLVAVAGRVNSGTDQMYFARVNAGNMQIYRIVSGTPAQLGSNVAVSFSNGETHSVRLSMNGTTIKAFFDDVEKISVTDSAISSAGYAGLRYVASSSSNLDNFNFGAYSSGASATFTITTADATFSGSGQVSPIASFALTSAAATFAGTASSGSSDATFSITTENSAFSGTATGDTSNGTLTTPALKNNTGTVLANETGATAYVYNPSTGALVVAKTSQTTDASGVMTITDALIAPSTQYRVVIVLGSGAEGMDKLTAT